MINYEQIKEILSQHGGKLPTPLVTESHEFPPHKNPSTLYVSKHDKKSLKALRARIKDHDYYSSIIIVRKVALSNEIMNKKKIVGHFDYSKILCGDCSNIIKHDKFEEHIDIGLVMMTPNGEVIPRHLSCPNCMTDYMAEINKLK